MMKVLVTGANGQLGSDVVLWLHELGLDYVGSTRQDFDLTSLADTSRFVRDVNPDAVVHCAAYTAVDRAEDEREECFQANVLGSENVAKVCRELDCKLLYVSTDYVFDGLGDVPFRVDDCTKPVNYYGETKRLGEQAVLEYVKKSFIVRVSWVFGQHGNNFVKTIDRISRERDVLTVVCDQIGSPSYTVDLARLIGEMIQTDRYGVYHGTNEGFCSWYDFACRICALNGTNTKVLPIPSAEYKTRAVRPQNSRLDKSCLDSAGFERLPDWEDALERFLSVC